MKTKVVVIGGGAAGLMAAYQARVHGADVFLIERNPNLGRKILISGKGRCNITNAKDIAEFIQNIPGNGNFLYSALNRFSNKDLIAFFESLGVKFKTERGGRVFPQSDRSYDIVKALQNAITKAGVNILYRKRVKDLILEEKVIKGVKFYDSNEQLYCDKLIIATGGLSYPETGSTGDGYKLALQAGHTIISPKPSLVPLTVKENLVKQLQGLTLKNVKAMIYINNKLIASEFGEMLFTHFGVSGPIILTLSRYVVDNLDKSVILSINLKPALNEKQLDERLKRDFEKYRKKIFKNALDDLLPKKMIPVFIKYCNINPEKVVNQITSGERKRIIKNLTDFRLTITGCIDHDAIVTKGGVCVKEINPKTMESKVIKNLFFAGEVIDIDGLTGGYNLQAAFSTGYLAGICAATSSLGGSE